MPELHDEENALYQLAPQEFVAARDALARRLRSGGDKAQAARIAKLRRPTPAAWALNQVARAEPALIERLRAAGNHLHQATQRAVAGDASGLRAAQTDERASVDEIVRAAASQLEQLGAGFNEATRQRLVATLRAAIVEPAVAEQLQKARLAGDHDAPGFGMDAFLPPGGGPGGAPAAGAPSGGGPPGGHPPPEPVAGGPPPEPVAVADQSETGPLDRHADAMGRAEAEAERLAHEWSRAVADADRLAAESAAATEEATRLTAEARQLATEAAHAARRAAEAESQAADAGSRAAEAASRAAAARTRSEEARTRSEEARKRVAARGAQRDP